MRTLEAVLIALIIALATNYLAEMSVVLSLRNRDIRSLEGCELIIAWLDASGVLKPWIYSLNYEALNSTLSEILGVPFELVVYDGDGGVLMIVRKGSATEYYSFAYLLTGVNGNLKPRLLVLRVAEDV